MMTSLTARALLFLVTFHILLNKHSPLAATNTLTSAAPASIITPAARLEDRDVNSVCGFWTNTAGSEYVPTANY
jgi:hypothetical protein